MRKRLLFFVSCLVVALAACSKSKTPSPPPQTQQLNTTASGATTSAESGKGKIDVCTLLTSKEIESVQGQALKEAKPSWRSGGGVLVSQCFFTLPTFSNSIVLTVTQKGDGPGAQDPKEFWNATFHRDQEKNPGHEEEEKSAPPQKIADLGDEAFWMGNRTGGALYVLKNNSYIRIGIGGAGDEATKIGKSKTLAQVALKHL